MNVRNFVLASLCVLMLASAAQAGDAVVADQPNLLGSDPVNTCDAYGTGFAKLPGTDTCVRMKGQLRYEMGVSQGATHFSRGRATMDIETRSDF